MLKIHWASPARNSSCDDVDFTAWSASAEPIFTRRKLSTTPSVVTALPNQSHTRNFAGTVLPDLCTLEPSALIGERIWWPATPPHCTPAAWYCTRKSRLTVVELPAWPVAVTEKLLAPTDAVSIAAPLATVPVHESIVAVASSQV